jgi:uncharacterized protein (UPF0333 family)
MKVKETLKKGVLIIMTIIMIAGVFVAIFNFTSDEAEAKAVWKLAHYITPTFIQCYDDGQDCVIVNPDQ